MALVEIRHLLDIPYAYRNGPDSDIHPEDGINCQLLVHVFYRQFLEVNLSPQEKSRETFEDGLFRPIMDEPYHVGDIFYFGPAGLTDARRLHLGVYIGEIQGEPLVLHANRVDGRVSIWPLSEFPNHPRYAQWYGVRRYGLLEEMQAAMF